MGFFAYGAVVGGNGREDDLAVGSVGDEDGLGHALVEGGDVVEFGGAVGLEITVISRRTAAGGFGVVEDADDGGVAAGEDAEDAAGTSGLAVSSGPAGGGFVDEDFVALHGSVELVGRDEEVVFAAG